ncbi:MAG: hypothetical protein JXQ87_11590 [Bacteroidia bacterium]
MKYISLLILIVYLGSCNSKEKTSASNSANNEKTDYSKQRETVSELNESDRLHPYPQILSKSLNGLELVHNAWESRFVLDLGNRLVQFIKPLDSLRFIVVSRGRDNMQFYLTDATTDGSILYEIQINKANWFIDKQSNFIYHDNMVHFYLENDTSEWTYDLNGKISIAENRLLDWNKIGDSDWQSGQDEISHSKELKITFNGGTDLIMHNLITGEKTNMTLRYFTTYSPSTLSVTSKRDIFPLKGKEKLPSMDEGRAGDGSNIKRFEHL